MQKRQSAQIISGLLLLRSPLATAPGTLKKAESLSLEQPLLSFQSKKLAVIPVFYLWGDESIPVVI
ncbi:hypothetical protein AH782_22565 [Salmonella enterica subsp. enterica]|nr:hypothetical protein [Salmonella enterica subsp. enterica serovar Rubislaw]EBO3471996.1 hypothetical protein [Salmonella enterica]EBV6048920.1 hypothetical protein [Salmonella enterica subsp. enterica serovar Gaminara]MEV22264.1 hypothetical protein [Salmonella enterica]